MKSVEDATLAEHFAETVNLLPEPGTGPSRVIEQAESVVSIGAMDFTEGLRFAPDWQSVAAAATTISSLGALTDGVSSTAGDAARGVVPAAYLPGWSRPMRVGILVSYLSVITPGYGGLLMHPEHQVETAGLLLHPGVQLVGIAERGSTRRATIERLMRDYDLTAGLIDASDAPACARWT